jgi:hypothetical protein
MAVSLVTHAGAKLSLRVVARGPAFEPPCKTVVESGDCGDERSLLVNCNSSAGMPNPLNHILPAALYCSNFMPGIYGMLFEERLLLLLLRLRCCCQSHSG